MSTAISRADMSERTLPSFCCADNASASAEFSRVCASTIRDKNSGRYRAADNTSIRFQRTGEGTRASAWTNIGIDASSCACVSTPSKIKIACSMLRLVSVVNTSTYAAPMSPSRSPKCRYSELFEIPVRSMTSSMRNPPSPCCNSNSIVTAMISSRFGVFRGARLRVTFLVATLLGYLGSTIWNLRQQQHRYPHVDESAFRVDHAQLQGVLTVLWPRRHHKPALENTVVISGSVT